MTRTGWILLGVAAVEIAVLGARNYSAAQRSDRPPTSPPSGATATPAPAQEIGAVSLEVLPGRIADAAGILGGFGDTLEWQTQSWRDDLGIEIHVVTLGDPGEPIEMLADRIFQLRQIGSDAPSGGLLVLLNPARAEARIEVSYALEHVFPDAVVGRIAVGQLAPYAAYRISGMAVMDVLEFLKNTAYLKAIRGDLALAPEYRQRPEFVEKARYLSGYLSGGAGARATLAEALKMDGDFKATVPEARRARYAPASDPIASAEAYLRALRDQVGDPTLDLYTPGSRCMLGAYPYAPFEQLERLARAESSQPLRATVSGDHAVADSDHPAHGFVPILLERRGGLWRVDLVETWKNLFFDEHGDYRQVNSNHPYAFALERLGSGRNYGIAQWSLGSSDLAAAQRTLASRGGALDDYLLGELLFRNCWLPLEAFQHYERAIALSPQNLLFHETLGNRASYIGFHELAVSAYSELGWTGLIPLARAQQAAGHVEAAIATARKALERDPYWIEAHELLHELLVRRGDASEAQRVERRIAEIRADPSRPDAPVALAFDPPRPILDVASPKKIRGFTVYAHSAFSATLTNSSGRDVQIVRVANISSGTAGSMWLEDIRDYWKYPNGSRLLRPGESVRFDKLWGFTDPTDHRQLRYVFDVCWKGAGERQCRAYWLDLFAASDVAIGLSGSDSRSVARSDAARIESAKRAAPGLAARLELIALLRSGRFDEATRLVEAEQAAFEADMEGRESITARLWTTFSIADPSLQPVLEAWSKAANSYAPLVALGIHHRNRGWHARGTRFASETSREQFAAMDEHFAKSRTYLLRALEMNPRLVVAWVNLIMMGKAHSDRDGVRRFLEQSAAICPSCVDPNIEYLAGLTPRWGGSYQEMERFLAELGPRIEAHPRLRVLLGAVADDRGLSAHKRGEYEAALRFYDDALSHGDYWLYRRNRGLALYRLARYDEALADIEGWRSSGRRAAEAFLWKSHVLEKMGRHREAAEAIEVARTLDPADAEIARFASYYDATVAR